MTNLNNSLTWLAKACNANLDLASADVIANHNHILLLEQQGYVEGFREFGKTFPVDARLTEMGESKVISLKNR